MIKDTEDSNEAIVMRRDGGDSTGVIGRGMLSKGLCRDLGEPMSSLIDRRYCCNLDTRVIWEPADQNPTCWRKERCGQEGEEQTASDTAIEPGDKGTQSQGNRGQRKGYR